MLISSSGPHSFSATVPLEPGFVITNEPGYYKEGVFGIRIESALVVHRVEVSNLLAPPSNRLLTNVSQSKEAPGSTWLAFERFTQVR